VTEESPHIGVLLFVAYRAMEQEIYDTLHELGFHATLAQGRLTARISEEGNRLTELAESAQVTKQTASALVD
jgi:DNA-binding MarR family transcriptional regulator